MNCDRFRELLDDHRRGLLSEAEAAEAESHLAGCADCRVLLAEADAIGRLLKEAQPSLPGDEYFSSLHGRALERMASDAERDTDTDRPAARVIDLPRAARRPAPPIRRWSIYAAAAVLLTAIGLSYMQVPRGRSSAERHIAMATEARAPEPARHRAAKAEVVREYSLAVEPAKEVLRGAEKKVPASEPRPEPAAAPAEAQGTKANESSQDANHWFFDKTVDAERVTAGAAVVARQAATPASAPLPALAAGFTRAGVAVSTPGMDYDGALPETQPALAAVASAPASTSRADLGRPASAVSNVAERGEMPAEDLVAIAQKPERVIASAASPSVIRLYAEDFADAKAPAVKSAENEMPKRAMAAGIPLAAAKAKGQPRDAQALDSAFGVPASTPPAAALGAAVPATPHFSLAESVRGAPRRGRPASSPQPVDAQQVYLDAESARLNGRYTEAFDMYNRVVQAAPGTSLAAQAQLRIGDLAREKLNMPDTAIAAYSRCLVPPLSNHLDETTLQAVRARLDSLLAPPGGTPGTPAP